MGYLVLQSSDEKRFDVIDGQQRLTTISIVNACGGPSCSSRAASGYYAAGLKSQGDVGAAAGFGTEVIVATDDGATKGSLRYVVVERHLRVVKTP
jgi:hypothetical protein